MIKRVTPFIMTAYFNATKSIQPQRRRRPVTEPNSCPRSHISLPVSSKSSVGNGPAPTLVQYALKIPYTSPIERGEIPKPLQAPAQMVLDEVTNGYEPKSTSNIVPCAPSQSMFFPSAMYWFTRCSLSTKRNFFINSTPSNHCFSASSMSQGKPRSKIIFS